MDDEFEGFEDGLDPQLPAAADSAAMLMALYGKQAIVRMPPAEITMLEDAGYAVSRSLGEGYCLVELTEQGLLAARFAWKAMEHARAREG